MKKSEPPAEFILLALPHHVVIEIAKMVGVDERHLGRFEAGLNLAVSIAHHVHAYHKLSPPRPSAMADLLADVIKKLADAERALAMLEGENVKPNRRMLAESAGRALDQEIDRMMLAGEDTSNLLPWKTEYEITNILPHLSELRAFLKIAIKAASSQSKELSRLFPKKPGAGSRTPAFDLFVRDLRRAVQSAGGNFTIWRYPTSDALEFKGSAIPALELLRPKLPKRHFFPTGILGYALERLMKRA